MAMDERIRVQNVKYDINRDAAQDAAINDPKINKN